MENLAEVLVVGAGVIGMAIAANLGEMGRSVILLDQFDYGRAASGTNLGQISLSDRQPGLERELVYQSLEQYKKANQKYRLEFRQSGGLTSLETDKEVEAAKPIVAQKKQMGYQLELLVGDQVRTVEPKLENLKGGVYSPEDGQLNPLRVNCWLYDRLRRAGVRFVSRTKVTGFIRKNSVVKGVETDQGNWYGQQVVLATGSWTKELMKTLRLDYPVDYIRGSAVVTEPCPRTLQGIVEDGGYFTGDVPDGSTIYFGGVQEDNGSILIAQANRTVENYDTALDEKDMATMVRMFVRHFPSLQNVQILRGWSGVTTLTRDEKPFWGFSTVYGNLFLAAGFKGAFSVAPAVGVRTAQWLCNLQTEESYRDWSPARIGG